MALRIAIYTRASRILRPDESMTIEQQERSCLAAATALEAHVVRVYSDPSKSAYENDYTRRPAFTQLLKDAAARQFDAVLVYKLDRFARRVLVQYQVAAELERLHIHILSATESIDRRTISGRMTFGVLALMAEAASAIHGERMSAIRMEEARRGRIIGPAPIGLERVNGEVRASAYAPMVRRAFELYSTGQLSFLQIAGQLTAEGWTRPDGQSFDAPDIKRMLANPVYCGQVHCGEAHFPAAFEAIIPVALFEAVQQARAARHPKRDVRTWSRATDQTGLLPGLLYCARCGAKLHYTHDRRSGNRYYYCSRRRKQGGCTARFTKAEAVEAAVRDLLTALRTFPEEWKPRLLELARAHVQERPRPTVPQLTPEDIQDRLKRLGVAYADGAFTDAEYHERRLALLSIAQEYQTPHAPAAPVRSVRELFALCQDIAGLFDRGSIEERRTILAQCFSRISVEVEDDGPRIIDLTPTALVAPILLALEDIYAPTGRVWTHITRSTVQVGKDEER